MVTGWSIGIVPHYIPPIILEQIVILHIKDNNIESRDIENRASKGHIVDGIYLRTFVVRYSERLVIERY